jgi:hypothetical protein
LTPIQMIFVIEMGREGGKGEKEERKGKKGVK